MTQKRLGIWMDHAYANPFDYTTGTVEALEKVETAFTKEEKEKVLLKGESSMHNKEQQKVKEFYTKLMETIVTYDDVILFGPTNAKTELFNMIKKDRHFDKIKISAKDFDYATPNQKSSFVSEHWTKQ